MSYRKLVLKDFGIPEDSPEVKTSQQTVKKRTALDCVDVHVTGEVFIYSDYDELRENTDAIVNAMRKHGMTSEVMVCMAFATAHAEVGGRLRPISEYISKYNTDKRPFDKYDFRKDLGNKGRGVGELYKGRGYIQLTGFYNYKQYGDRLGVNLIKDPELANRTDIAAEIMVLFLKDKRERLFQALLKSRNKRDYRLARRLVNGGSHGLQRFIYAYDTIEDLIDPEVEI